MKETEISTLGEFGLIEHLTKSFPVRNASTHHGVGDDCAVINYGNDRETLVTTDLLLEGIHFDLTYVPLMHLGYKAIVVNLSDVYAMNGTPRQVTVSLGISKRFTLEHIEQLYEGMRIACEHYGVDLVGGDTSASVTGLIISVTCLGEAAKDDIIYRSGAKDTDLICVSGNLGAAYMGLQLLERERRVSAEMRDKDFQPDFSGKEYIIERQLKPEARRDVLEEMRELGIRPTAMMDVSDGLSSELLHICKASGTGCRVFEERIPIDYQTALMAEELNMNLVTAAMNGGEDYELLFTIGQGDYEKIKDNREIHIIGHITEAGTPAVMVTPQNSTIELRAQGWGRSENC